MQCAHTVHPFASAHNQKRISFLRVTHSPFPKPFFCRFSFTFCRLLANTKNTVAFNRGVCIIPVRLLFARFGLLDPSLFSTCHKYIILMWIYIGKYKIVFSFIFVLFTPISLLTDATTVTTSSSPIVLCFRQNSRLLSITPRLNISWNFIEWEMLFVCICAYLEVSMWTSE